jgi:hypothetical protein
VKKLVLLGGIAVASAALLQPAVAAADPSATASANVVGLPYAKAVTVLKSQGMRATFGGSFGSDVPQSACIVSQQKMLTSGRMVLNLDCTLKAVKDATADTPAGGAGGVVAAPAAPGAPAAPAPSPGTPGQGTYGGPIGVPVPVG